MTVSQALDLAIEHHRAGRCAEAEALYRQILAAQPQSFDALHLLGVLCHQTGHHVAAVQLIQQAISLQPNEAVAHSNLGEAQRALGQLDEAIASFRRAVELQPAYAEAHSNLGNALRENGRFDEAVAACRRAVELRPDLAMAHLKLGDALQAQGEIESATAAYRAALELQPNHARAYNHLGIALQKQSALEEAMTAHRRALEIEPGYADAHYNLGNALKDRGRLDEAIATYRRALELEANDARVHNNLAVAFQELGQIEEAIAAYRHAMQLAPAHAGIHSNLVHALHLLPGLNQASISSEQQHWNRHFGKPPQGQTRPYENDRDAERRLRIGYVSPDFRDHVVGRNLLPLFQRHDPQNVEILCYSGTPWPDELTTEFQARAAHWRSTVGMADEQLAEAIRNDRVDILVDLSQHTAGNRLPLFAHRPAPVQVSFAGYPDTTGLEAIGYRMSDRWVEEGRMPHAECGNELVFLLDSFWCYDPCGIDLAVNALPVQERGCVTFGSLANLRKINEPLLRLWARVLGGCPRSRLLLLTGASSQRERTWEILAGEGIERSRVEFAERCSRQRYHELYHGLDIVLDPFPYNGHTSCLDALWMGVPVVSLAGESRVSRGGLSVLSNLGLTELVAHAEDDYVQIAVRLAGDLPRLAELRRTLRGRMEASVLMDSAHFARGIEAAYRAMWRQWCMDRQK